MTRIEELNKTRMLRRFAMLQIEPWCSRGALVELNMIVNDSG
jgi:hypothetical protein